MIKGQGRIKPPAFDPNFEILGALRWRYVAKGRLIEIEHQDGGYFYFDGRVEALWGPTSHRLADRRPNG